MELAEHKASQSQEADYVCSTLIQDEDINVSSDNTDTNLGPQKCNKTEETVPAHVAAIAVEIKRQE